MKRVFATCAALALAAWALQTQAQPKPAPAPPAGVYTLDKAHSTLVFRVSHLGFSRYTARFAHLDATLQFDPAHPTAMGIAATVDPLSLELPPPPPGFLAELTGPHWLDAGKFAKMEFHSTKVEVTGPNTARVTGELTLHGVTKPIVLETTYNGGYPPNAMDPGGARVGFSAHTAFKRSEFGITVGIPAPGSNMGVGDEVDVAIETEFNHPAK